MLLAAQNNKVIVLLVFILGVLFIHLLVRVSSVKHGGRDRPTSTGVRLTSGTSPSPTKSSPSSTSSSSSSTSSSSSSSSQSTTATKEPPSAPLRQKSKNPVADFNRLITTVTTECQTLNYGVEGREKIFPPGDGQWVFCVPKKTSSPGECVVVSADVKGRNGKMYKGDDWRFDEYMGSKMQCAVYVFSPNVTENAFYQNYHSPRIRYTYARLGTKDETPPFTLDGDAGWPVVSIANVIKNNSIATIDMLKLDLEGYEFSFLDEVQPAVLQAHVKQLAFEIHVHPLGTAKCQGNANKECNVKAQGVLDTLSVLNEAGFSLVSHIPNEGCPFCHKLTMVNERFLGEYTME